MRFICGLLALVLTVAVQAQTKSFRVSDIRVEGLQRVSSGTVFTALPVRVGDAITEEDIQNATRELFKVGFFSDVAIQRDGDVLVLQLKERPAINKIDIEGNKAIKKENLMDSLKKNNLSEGQIFQRATLDLISQSLQREYIAQGRYGATVKIEIEDLPRNQVKVKVKITEGAVARIKQINIVGNTKFNEQELVELFELKTTGMWSWFSGNDKYSKEKMKGDLERLESYYMDRGYLAFKTESSQISLSLDKSQIFITVNIHEGDIYKVNDVVLAGDSAIDENELRRNFLIQKGDIFSQVLMTATSEALKQRLGVEGYTFAKVQSVPDRNEADKTVKLTFLIDPGKRAYVNRINFHGNTKTMDEVLRREMRQMEGGAASTTQIESSKVRLERLGFFKEVKVDTKEVPGSPDKVDVDFNVEEQPSGNMTFSVGYAQYYGLSFQAGIQQTNWFGTGKQIGFSFGHNKYQTSYSLNYGDPYFTPDGVSRGYSIYYQKSKLDGYTPYSTNTYGGKLNFGYPISDVERIGFDIGLRRLEVVPTGFSAEEIVRTPVFKDGIAYDSSGNAVSSYISSEDYNTLLSNFRNGNGIDYPSGAFVLSPITDDLLGPKGFLDLYGSKFSDAQVNVYWSKSTLNRGVLPDAGSSQHMSAEATLPGGDLEYYKLDYQAQKFIPLNSIFTLKVRGHAGFGESYGKSSRLPFFENFYGGGFGSVRGYENNSLGPRASVQEAAYTVNAIWDDRNGNGIVEPGETAMPVMVMCKNDPDCINGDGKLKTYKTSNDYGRTLGSFGGNLIIEGGAEILFPLPFIKDRRSLQTTLFFDAGNVFDTSCSSKQNNCFDLSGNQFKTSVGLGLTWISSMGPMQFSLAKPLGKRGEYDRERVFDFSVGRTF